MQYHHDLAIVNVEIVPARIEDKEIVRQLLEFNAYEFSRFFDDADVDSHGRFGYRYLNEYWTEPSRHPFLIRVDDRTAGMVLVREGEPHSIAEFLVLPRYRRGRVGTTAARQAFERFVGRWEVHQIPRNEDAVSFWRRAIPVEFTETSDENGTTQRFVIAES